MTEKTILVCDDCLEEIENVDKAVIKYRQKYPNNEVMFIKEHYHPSCNIPDGEMYYDSHPISNGGVVNLHD